MPNVGKARAKKLYDSGITNVKELLNFDELSLRKIINLKGEKFDQIVKAAKELG